MYSQVPSLGAPVASGIDGTLRGRLTGDSLALSLAAANGQGLKAEGNVVLPTVAMAEGGLAPGASAGLDEGAMAGAGPAASDDG